MKMLVKVSALVGLGSMTLFGFTLFKNEGEFTLNIVNLQTAPIPSEKTPPAPGADGTTASTATDAVTVHPPSLREGVGGRERAMRGHNALEFAPLPLPNPPPKGEGAERLPDAGQSESVDCTGISREECRDLAEMEALGRRAEQVGVTEVRKQRLATDGTLHKEIRQTTQATLQGVAVSSASDGRTATAVVH